MRKLAAVPTMGSFPSQTIYCSFSKYYKYVSSVLPNYLHTANVAGHSFDARERLLQYQWLVETPGVALMIA